jgi:hypothetical protein
MHRSSESIASLAAALAKAQVLLTNPEKSLTATVGSDRYDEPGHTFRYAPLSSGLDIVRKALGQNEIATVQTTAIDPATQAVSLTTVLAHSSGEWIASDWPVCALSEMAMPRRMGAALTYARRYALFTLVGIAGEDDLDAPDLAGQPTEGARTSGNGAAKPLGPFSAKRKPWSPPKQVLDPGKSAATRDRLLGELTALTDPDQATLWAHRSIAAKNTLMGADAAVVEAAFASRVAELASTSSVEAPLPPPQTAGQGEATPLAETAEPASRVALMTALRASVELTAVKGTAHPSARGGASQEQERVTDAVACHIDKSALPLNEPRRYRDRDHLKFVSLQPCLICGRRPSDAHHLRFAQPRALGRRVSDEFTVPLCRTHHRVLHNRGDEAAWWESVKVDPIVVARTLWKHARLNEAPVHRRIGTSLPSATASTVRDPETPSGDHRGAGSDPKEPLVGPSDR